MGAVIKPMRHNAAGSAGPLSGRPGPAARAGWRTASKD